jgi:periplasmic divalent cation tolerance protein
MDSKYIIIFITVDTQLTAQKIAEKLLTEHKAACVNIIPKVKSHYWWQGKIESADELMLVVKTRAALLPDVEKLVKSLHPYTVPEIIAIPIIGGNQDYLDWIEKETIVKSSIKSELPQLLKKVNKNNLHPEIDFGPSTGKEIL